MSNESGPASGTPINFHGGGWVFERVDGEIAVHREGVDPASCDAGDCLYLSPDELLGFCAVASFAGETMLAEGMTTSTLCPVEFEVMGRIVFRMVGVPPRKGERIQVPEEGKVSLERVVVDLRSVYQESGARTVIVVCQ